MFSATSHSKGVIEDISDTVKLIVKDQDDYKEKQTKLTRFWKLGRTCQKVLSTKIKYSLMKK